MLFDALLGNIDEDKQYYTDDMFQKDLGRFVLYVLAEKKLLTDEDVEKYKPEFMKFMNEACIAELIKLKRSHKR